MNNLFVLHTQYNIILAMALIEEKYKECYNKLILFRDFNLSDDMLKSLKSYFSKVEVYTGSYNKADLRWRKKIFRYPLLRREFSNDDVVYDNIFLVEDTIVPEQCLMQITMKKNPNVHIGYVGDGGDAYFTNIVSPTGLAKHKYTMVLRKILFKYLFGLGDFYYSANCFGSSPLVQTVYELYPDSLREELQNKEHHSIRTDCFITAIRKLFCFQKPQLLESNAVIIMLDKLEVYGDFKKFDAAITEVVELAKLEGREIYYKYHPAEKSSYPKASEWIEIDRKNSAEFILSCGHPESTWIVGIMTTALQTAAKMGYRVTSYIESFNPDRKDVIDLYKKIGIEIK